MYEVEKSTGFYGNLEESRFFSYFLRAGRRSACRNRTETPIIRVCEDTDGILIVDKNGIIRDHRIAMNYYWKEEETVGHHIRELYPGLDEDSSTILRALRTGQAIYDQRQELGNSRGGAGRHHHPHRGER